MSTPDKDVPAVPDKPAAAKKGGAVLAMASIVLTAVMSGGAAFAAVRFVGAPKPPPVVIEHVAARPPGPTVPLEPFVASLPDAAGQMRALKLTIAIELEHEGKAEDCVPFVPRIRDTALSYLRERTFEQVTAPTAVEVLRTDLLARFEAAGLVHARKVLVTDLITQ